MRTAPKATKRLCKANEQSENVENKLKIMEEIRHVTNFINNKALGFEQTSPLAVPLYSFRTQFAQSALFCVHPKRGCSILLQPLSCYVGVVCYGLRHRICKNNNTNHEVK